MAKLEANTQRMKGFAGALKYTPPGAYPGQSDPNTMPGAVALNQAAISATTRGEVFSKATAAGFDSFKQITTACATKYEQNDTAGADKIASTGATVGSQAEIVAQIRTSGQYDRLRAIHPDGHWQITGNTDLPGPAPRAGN